MTILLEKECMHPLELDYESIAEEVVSAVLDYLECPYECEVNILLTDNPGIQETNRRMRNMDAPTDVLSFPTIEFEKAGDFSVVEQDTVSYFNGDSGELMLGDIMISLDKVAEQAAAYNHSEKREYAFLIAHSMLHLSGYDHMEQEERSRMEQLQEAILQDIGYNRSHIQ